MGWLLLNKDERSEQLYKQANNFDFTYLINVLANV